MLETLYKVLRNIHLNDEVHGIVFQLGGVKKSDFSASGLPMFLAESCLSSEAFLQFQHPTVLESSTTTLDAVRNIVREIVKLSESKPVDSSVYYRAQGSLSTSAIVTSRKLMGHPSRSPNLAAEWAYVERSSISGGSICYHSRQRWICLQGYWSGWRTEGESWQVNRIARGFLA